MNQVSKNLSKVRFETHFLELDQDPIFRCYMSQQAQHEDLSLVLDVYDSNNPVHPEGHIGWWQFDISSLKRNFTGRINIVDEKIDCSVADAEIKQKWLNESEINWDSLILIAVLRNNITNAITFLDKIPVFRHKGENAIFRSSFNRDWNLPQFAPSNYIFPSKTTIRIVARNIFESDAVGNFALSCLRLLKQNSIPVMLYAENFDLSLNDVIRRIDDIFDDVDEEDSLLYFASTYDPYLEEIIDLPFRQRLAYLHGITPPELLRVFDPELSSLCQKAYEQLEQLSSFDRISANSEYTANSLLPYIIKNEEEIKKQADKKNVISDKKVLVNLIEKLMEKGPEDKKKVTVKFGDIEIIPPIISSLDDTRKQSSKSNINLKSDKTIFLYVGRIFSHKKIEDILYFFDEYLKIDPESELWIVGGGDNQAYRDYLNWILDEELKLPRDQVRWFGLVSDKHLEQLFSTATAYISLSEHEGFCIPIFDAMVADLPVIAGAIPAVRKLLGNAGIGVFEKDFGNIARQVHAILSQPMKVENIIKVQRERVAEIYPNMDGRKLLSFLNPHHVECR